jgi:hypothetical protein
MRSCRLQIFLQFEPFFLGPLKFNCLPSQFDFIVMSSSFFYYLRKNEKWFWWLCLLVQLCGIERKGKKKDPIFWPVSIRCVRQGCQIVWYNVPKREKYTKWP